MLSEHSTCWCSQNRWRLVLERFQPFRRCWSRFYKCVAWVNCLQVSSGFYFGLQFCVKEDRPEKERVKTCLKMSNICGVQSWKVPMWLQVMNLQRRGTVPVTTFAPHCTSLHLEWNAWLWFLFQLGRPVCYHVECAADTLSYSLKALDWESELIISHIQLQCGYISIHISCKVYKYIESGKFQLMEIHSRKSTFVIVFEDESVLQLVAPCRLVSSIDK